MIPLANNKQTYVVISVIVLILGNKYLNLHISDSQMSDLIAIAAAFMGAKAIQLHGQIVAAGNIASNPGGTNTMPGSPDLVERAIGARLVNIITGHDDGQRVPPAPVPESKLKL